MEPIGWVRAVAQRIGVFDRAPFMEQDDVARIGMPATMRRPFRRRR